MNKQIHAEIKESQLSKCVLTQFCKCPYKIVFVFK